MMNILRSFCICFIGLTIAQALPTQSSQEEATLTLAVNSSNYASVASQIITTNLLKSYIDRNVNQVYSPLGLAVQLAILAEATNGETYDEFHKVFGFPKDRTSLRASYRRLLAHYQRRDDASEPLLKTWLYLYPHYSAREEFNQLIKEHYFVEVKNMNSAFYDWSKLNITLDDDIETETPTTLRNSKDIIGFETLKRLKKNTDTADEVAAKALKDGYGEEILRKKASKFDVEDKQSEEKPVMLNEIKSEVEKVGKAAESLDKVVLQKNEQDLSEAAENQELKEMQKREEQLIVEENETVLEDERTYKNYNEQTADKIIVPSQGRLTSNKPEKVSSPLQKFENAMQLATKEADEIMIALESHLSSVRRALGAHSLINKDGITYGMSGNFIKSRKKVGFMKKMLLVNGLYFRGNWANSFLKLQAEQLFFMTAEETMKTTMMHASGSYITADLKHLNAKALYIPYENKQYTLLLVVPNEIEGLHSLIEKIQPSDITAMPSLGQEKHLHVILPKFQVETLSFSQSMLKNLGLRKLFSREDADVSLLTDDRDVHVNGISQFITVYIDEGENSNDALSAATTKTHTPESAELETFEVNRPFLYFVMDLEKELAIVSGKIYEPEYRYAERLSIEHVFRDLSVSNVYPDETFIFESYDY